MPTSGTGRAAVEFRVKALDREHAVLASSVDAIDESDARRQLGLPMQPHLVSSSLRAVSAMRATVGFVEFFLAFSLRRAHASSWWFGLLIVAISLSAH